MTNFRTMAATLALGLALGGTLATVLRPPAPAGAERAMAAMNMGSKSAGDSEMNAAMERMTQSMTTSKLTGAQDRDFMIMMIPHHQSAVDMARIELRRGSHPALKALARAIISSQASEIAQMHGWLAAWYRERP